MNHVVRPFTRTMVATIALGCLLLAAPEAANAAPPILPYAQIGLGVGKVDGSRVIITQVPNSADMPVDSGSSGCCPESGLALDLRLGVKLFGGVAIEGGLLGQGWALGGDERGGAGFAGGGVRLYTLGLVELATDPLELPVDLSFGLFFGYAAVGKDFAYTGSVTGFDATLEWAAADFVTIGARANYWIPNYGSFVYTDFNKDIGRCLGTGGTQPDGLAVHEKGSEVCGGDGPSATFFSPQIVATFLFDLI